MPRRCQLRCTPAEEYPGEFATPEPRIEFGGRGMDEEQNEDPDLDRNVPGQEK
jgi:hypothetical protein